MNVFKGFMCQHTNLTKHVHVLGCGAVLNSLCSCGQVGEKKVVNCLQIVKLLLKSQSFGVTAHL